jgi:hypothetical protein
MRVHRGNKATITLTLSEEERALLLSLTDEIVGLLDERDTEPEGAMRDPALLRLLPDAYQDDQDASAEFRRFTEDELAGAKTSDARAVAMAVRDDEVIVLNRDSVRPWLRSITDLRLALAVRLGIREDGDEGDTSPEAEPTQQVYFWLGYLQESLLAAL